MGNELQTIIKDSGLTGNKAQDIVLDFQDYFAIAAEWDLKAKAIVVTDCSQKEDMEKARKGRLFLKEKRIAIEKRRKELKEDCLREGQAIDGIAKILKGLIEPIELYLEEQEKYVEIQQEAARRKAKFEADQKAEAERIESEKKAAEEQKRIREENEKLRREAAERDRIIAKERQENEAKIRAAEAKVRAEKENAKKAIEEAERKAADEQRRFQEEIEFHEKALAEANMVIEEQQTAIAQITCPKCGHNFDPEDGKF